jgi:hypothetical protein
MGAEYMRGVMKEKQRVTNSGGFIFSFPPDKGGNYKGGLLRIHVVSKATPVTTKNNNDEKNKNHRQKHQMHQKHQNHQSCKSAMSKDVNALSHSVEWL